MISLPRQRQVRPESERHSLVQMKKSAEPGRLVLRLYVTGTLPNSVNALANLRKLCDLLPAGATHIDVVDVLQDPIRALTDGIVATPTLVRLAPEPVVRIFGTLAETAHISSVLGLDSQIRP